MTHKQQNPDFQDPERASAYLAAIIESSDDAIISKDLNGIITSWNPAAIRIFGYQPEEVIGMHISIIIPPDRLNEEYEILTKLKSGQRIDHFETLRRSKTGEIIELSITASPIYDKDGTIIGASKVARDITARRKTEEALLELSKRKDEFLANVSHELRTPMNAVVGLANILGMSQPLTDRQRQFVNTLKISADNLLSLINDLLDFSRLASGHITLEDIEFSLPAITEKVMNVMSVKAREKGITLQAHFSPDLPHHYLGDPLRLQQIMTNLVSNAVKFTPMGSVDVYVAGEPANEDGIAQIKITVVDTGIGISADKHSTIFEKFSQADASITRQYGGSGLGLAITRSLVDMLGGDITIDSALGKGATFTVTLPLQKSNRSTTPSEKEKFIRPIQSTPKKILLVEDYAPNTIVATALLDAFGYHYDVAADGAEALRKFENGHFHLILMDVQMPGMDGLEATRRIRSLEKERSMTAIPIVAMTAHVQEQDHVLCLSAGMNDFLPKPFDPEMLADKLRKLIIDPV